MRTLFVILTLLFLLTACDGREEETSAPPADYPTTRGVFATHSFSENPSTEELDWLASFAVVEIGGLWYEPPEGYRSLKERGVRVLGYDWMPAVLYWPGGENIPIAEWLYENRDWASLNPKGPYPHCEESYGSECQDYYFDYGKPAVVAEKTSRLTARAEGWGWDGIFFDWASGVFIFNKKRGYQQLAETFTERHPETSYLEAVGSFYEGLRERFEGLVVTNQGFRNPENVLPHTDYDVAESYAVTEKYLGRVLEVEGRGEIEVPDTIYYPVSPDERDGKLSDTLDYLRYLAGLEAEHAGERFKGFIYINYAAPRFVPKGDGTYRAETPKNAILFGYAVPKLLGYTGYTEVPFDRSLERLPVYQADLGEPLGGDYEEQEGVYVRFYERGLVLVGELLEPKTVRLRSPYIKGGWLYDFYSDSWIRAEEGVLELTLYPECDPVTDRTAPVGRVLVYGR